MLTHLFIVASHLALVGGLSNGSKICGRSYLIRSFLVAIFQLLLLNALMESCRLANCFSAEISSSLQMLSNVPPTYISEHFTLRNNVNTGINLRSTAASCFIPPKPRTEYFKRSLRYSGCLVWNSLPEEVKIAQTIDTFHNRCLKWLTNQN